MTRDEIHARIVADWMTANRESDYTTWTFVEVAEAIDNALYDYRQSVTDSKVSHSLSEEHPGSLERAIRISQEADEVLKRKEEGYYD